MGSSGSSTPTATQATMPAMNVPATTAGMLNTFNAIPQVMQNPANMIQAPASSMPIYSDGSTVATPGGSTGSASPIASALSNGLSGSAPTATSSPLAQASTASGGTMSPAATPGSTAPTPAPGTPTTTQSASPIAQAAQASTAPNSAQISPLLQYWDQQAGWAQPYQLTAQDMANPAMAAGTSGMSPQVYQIDAAAGQALQNEMSPQYLAEVGANRPTTTGALANPMATPGATGSAGNTGYTQADINAAANPTGSSSVNPAMLSALAGTGANSNSSTSSAMNPMMLAMLAGAGASSTAPMVQFLQ